MPRQLHWKTATAAGVAALVAGAVHSETAPNPWAKVPALPTNCYSSQDTFSAKGQSVLEALSDEQQKQELVNRKSSEQLSASVNADPMAMAARMQEQMMKDPQAAMKYMQQMGATEDPAATQAAAQRSMDRTKQIKAEQSDLVKRYGVAHAAALAPARAKFLALRKKLGITEGWGVGESGTADWAFAEYDAIKRQADQAYQSFCPGWWGASGLVPAYLKRYKEYLATERISAGEKRDAQLLTNYAMQGISTTGYKSTATLEAVQDYIKVAESLYSQRNGESFCSTSSCRDVGGI